MPHHVHEHLALGAVQYLHQVAHTLLPDVERVLTRRAGAYELAVAREAALLPQRAIDEILQLLQRLRIVAVGARRLGAVR